MNLPARCARRRGFTLLELLAAVALLVVLGTLLFQIFTQASHVMRIGTGRQEIYQYARALYTTLEHEFTGAIAQRDASRQVVSSSQSRPFHIYHSSAQLAVFGLPAREGTDAISLTSALVGRDTVQTSPTYGQTATDAHVAYWVGPSDCTTNAWTLNRYESYDIASSLGGRGWEFALNVLEFRIECFDQYRTPPDWQAMDWDSTAIDTPTASRRGLPFAVAVTMKLTDRDHLPLYEFDAANKVAKLHDGLTSDDDPMAQQFRHVIRLREQQ